VWGAPNLMSAQNFFLSPMHFLNRRCDRRRSSAFSTSCSGMTYPESAQHLFGTSACSSCMNWPKVDASSEHFQPYKNALAWNVWSAFCTKRQAEMAWQHPRLPKARLQHCTCTGSDTCGLLVGVKGLLPWQGEGPSL
jgi:hypothetical protein